MALLIQIRNMHSHIGYDIAHKERERDSLGQKKNMNKMSFHFENPRVSQYFKIVQISQNPERLEFQDYLLLFPLFDKEWIINI